jgi:hypothetical protein
VRVLCKLLTFWARIFLQSAQSYECLCALSFVKINNLCLHDTKIHDLFLFFLYFSVSYFVQYSYFAYENLQFHNLFIIRTFQIIPIRKPYNSTTLPCMGCFYADILQPLMLIFFQNSFQSGVIQTLNRTHT